MDIALSRGSDVIAGNLVVVVIVGGLVLFLGRAREIRIEAMLAASATVGHPAQSMHQGIPGPPLLGAPHISTPATWAPKNIVNRFHP